METKTTYFDRLVQAVSTSDKGTVYVQMVEKAEDYGDFVVLTTMGGKTVTLDTRNAIVSYKTYADQRHLHVAYAACVRGIGHLGIEPNHEGGYDLLLHGRVAARTDRHGGVAMTEASVLLPGVPALTDLEYAFGSATLEAVP